MFQLWNQIVAPFIVVLIGLLVEYWIIQPLRKLNRREFGLSIVAILTFPVSILILVAVIVDIARKQGSVASGLYVTSPQYPFLDVLTLTILLYVMGVLIMVLYRSRLSTFQNLQQQRDSEAAQQFERWLRSATPEQITQWRWKRNWYDWPSREWTEQQELEQLRASRGELNGDQVQLAALLAVLAATSLFAPIMVLWLWIFFAASANLGIVFLAALGVLVFTNVYLHYYGQCHDGCLPKYISFYSSFEGPLAWLTQVGDFLQREFVIKSMLVAGFTLLPALLFAYRTAINLQLGPGLFAVAIPTAFLLIPTLWAILLDAAFFIGKVVVYLYAPVRHH